MFTHMMTFTWDTYIRLTGFKWPVGPGDPEGDRSWDVKGREMMQTRRETSDRSRFIVMVCPLIMHWFINVFL